ncbi:HDOD domain-containing protein [Azospira sp. I13]|uniref:HDOD domain-containing protein n=1 Tax=Azospira sp. I13 TaxID=1765050 RepID=UPI000D4B164A|nr:HDOD domain-containing protein [Azospira sp. I13]GBG04044.1 HDOD domain-containing protein [Azospira sp. I13]
MRTIDEAEVSKLLRGVEIPPCPAVLASLAQEMHRPDASSVKVAKLISQDVGLAAGVIKCANSPLFGTGSKVASIGEALGRLGFNNVLNLVVNELLRKSLSQKDSHAMERFWDSATYCAGVCAKLAEILPGTSRDTAYTFGLFHDCGIPILMRRYPDYKKTLALANQTLDRSFTAVEEEMHGTSHAVIGYLMARNWGLPETVSSAILSHHDFSVFESGSGLSDESCTLIALALLSERIIGTFLRLKDDGEWEKGKLPVAGFFGLSETDLNDIVDDLLFKLDSARKAA